MEFLKELKEKILNAEKKLNNARNEYDEYDDLVYEDIYEDEEVLQKIKSAEEELEAAKAEYRTTVKKIINTKIQSNTLNSFEKNFYLATRFCKKDYEELPFIFPILHCVKIYSDKISATNGFIGINIYCNEIPEHLKGKLITWDTIDIKDPKFLLPLCAFPGQTGSEMVYDIKGEFPDIEEIIKDNSMKLTESASIRKEEFGKKFQLYIVELAGQKVLIANFDGTQIALNPEFVDYILDCFNNSDEIVVKWEDSLSPVIFSKDTVQAIIMPIKTKSC